MILTKKEAEQYDNGKIKSKRLFLKLINTIDFDKYMLRYCKVIKEERNDFWREWYFNEFNHTIIVSYYLGEFQNIRWYENR